MNYITKGHKPKVGDSYLITGVTNGTEYHIRNNSRRYEVLFLITILGENAYGSLQAVSNRIIESSKREGVFARKFKYEEYAVDLGNWLNNYTVYQLTGEEALMNIVVEGL